MSEHPPEQHGRILRFRSRGAPQTPRPWPAPQSDRDQVAGLGHYEKLQGEDDYRHRMTMNILALAAATFLVLIGLWLAISIADMRKNQDCYLQGGRNCNQLAVPQTER